MVFTSFWHRDPTPRQTPSCQSTLCVFSAPRSKPSCFKVSSKCGRMSNLPGFWNSSSLSRCCFLALVPIENTSPYCSLTLARAPLCQPPSKLYAADAAPVMFRIKQCWYFKFLRQLITLSTLHTANMSLHRKFSHASITSAQIPSCVHLPCCSGASDVLVALILVELGGHGQNLLQCQPRSVNIMLQLDDLPLLPPIPSTHQQPPLLHLFRAHENIQRWITRWNADRAIYKLYPKFNHPLAAPGNTPWGRRQGA